MKITSEALRMLSAEQAALPDAQDGLDRLAFLVGPLLLPLDVEYKISSQRLSDIIEENFGLKLPIEVSQTLLFRLANRGFIKQTRIEDSSIFFGLGADKIENPTAVQDLIKDFRLFVEDKSLLPKISDDEILELFMEIVFALDEIEDNFNTSKYESKKIDEWKKSLTADYVLQKSNEDGELPPLLARLAELCLLRSIVGNLTQQKVKTAKSQMVALLDAPLALYAIGASGKKQKSNIDSTLAEAKKIGIKICILPISHKEMTRVLKGVLETPHVDRRGPTAAAIRAQEISEIIVQDIRKNPEKYTKKAGIDTIPRTLSSYPAEKEFFNEDRYKEFSTIASRWSKTRDAEEHDAEALTITMRARKSKHERNLFFNSYTFITGNWAFANSARKFCLEEYAINESVTPPIVHFTFFSASIWIASGFPVASRLPEKTLLAACERTLSGQSGVVSKAAKLFQEFKFTDEEHLQAYIQDRDCVGAIVRETYNDPSLIDENNIAELFEKVKNAAAGDVLKKTKAQTAELKKKFAEERDEINAANEKKLALMAEKANNERENLEGSIKALDQTVSELQESMRQREAQRRRNIESRVEGLNKVIQKRNLVDFIEFSFFTLASLLVCFQVSLKLGVGAFIIGYAFVAASYFEKWIPYKIKMNILHWYSMKKLNLEFSNSEVSEWRITLNDEFQFVIGIE